LGPGLRISGLWRDRDLGQMTDAETMWSRCMANAGYSGLTAPGAVVNVFDSGAGSNVPNVPVELKVAKADFGCQLKTILPVEHAFEMTAAQQLASSFPQYSDRIVP
jgi:hypothetical protein